MSTLSAQTNTYSKVTLISNVVAQGPAGFGPYVNGMNHLGGQLQIHLSVLPPGVQLSMIEAGQTWWVDNKTTRFTLVKYIGTTFPFTLIPIPPNAPGYVLASDPNAPCGMSWVKALHP